MTKNNATLKKLKVLTRERLSEEDNTNAFEQLMNEESDRAAAIIAATWLEESLNDLLMSSMRPLKKDWKDKIFGLNAPLSTFSSMINIGYAFEFYDQEVVKQLGSGLIDYSQKMTVAAIQMAEKNVWAHLS